MKNFLISTFVPVSIKAPTTGSFIKQKAERITRRFQMEQCPPQLKADHLEPPLESQHKKINKLKNQAKTFQRRAFYFLIQHSRHVSLILWKRAILIIILFSCGQPSTLEDILHLHVSSVQQKTPEPPATHTLS